MSPKHDNAWRWTGASQYRVQPGDTVFLSLDENLPVALWPELSKGVTALGLRSVSYQGLRLPDPEITGSTYVEALDDFYGSQVLVVLLTEAGDTEHWVLSEIPYAIDRGVAVLMCFCSEERKEFVSRRAMDEAVLVREVTEPGLLPQLVCNELRRLMQ